MNKSLILVLAICLVSVHAFVKRDAPPENNYMEEIGEKAKDLGATVQKALEEFIDPKKAKEKADELISQVSTAFNNAVEHIKPKEAEAPKA